MNSSIRKNQKKLRIAKFANEEEERIASSQKVVEDKEYDDLHHHYRMISREKTRDGMIGDIAFTTFIFTKLDYFLHGVLALLNIKKLQGKLFIEKVGEILRILEIERTTTLPEQEIERILSLALPIELVPVQSWLGNLRASNKKYIWTIDNPWMVLGEVPEVVQQISFITETHLQRFLDDTDFYNKWEDFRNNLGLLPTREAIRNLLRASQELKEALNFLHEVGTEKTILYQYLAFLCTFLKESEFSNECHGDQELMKCIRGVLNEALCAVYRSIVHCMGFGTEEEAKLVFEGKNGLRLVLLETLGKLHSFNGCIDVICDKLGKENFQSWSASRSSILHTNSRTLFQNTFLF